MNLIEKPTVLQGTVTFTTLATLLGAFATGNLAADMVVIDGIGGGTTLESGAIQDVLGGSNHQMTAEDLAAIQADVHNSGVNTSGRITFLLASTDAGLTFVSLFDGTGLGDPPDNSDSFLGMTSVTNNQAYGYANTGTGGGYMQWFDLGNGMQMANGQFAWDHEAGGAGFAWGNIEFDDVGTFNFYDLGLDKLAQQNTFQFLTHTGENWEIASFANFTSSGQFAFSYRAVPAPGALALLAIAGMTGRGRRRRS